MRCAGLVTLVAAVALLFASSVARTDQGSHHRKDSEHGHGGHDAAPAQAEGLAGAWRALEAARDAIAAEVEAGRLDTIHEKSEPVPELARALLEHSGHLEATKRVRVEAAIGQIPKVAAALHEAADAGDTARTERELKRLDGLLALIRAQYPQDALSAPASHHGGGSHSRRGSGESHAGGSDVTRDDEHAHRRAMAEVDEQAEETVRVVANDFTFEPRELSLRAGQPTRIEFRNKGAVEHALIVKTLDGAADAIHLHARAGEVDAATVRLDEPGRYAILCTIPGHREVGMVGELVVIAR